MESWTTVGVNLAGTKTLRRFYALNPAKAFLAVPVTRPTGEEIRGAKDRAQSLAIQKEREGLHLQCESSVNPLTRAKA